MWARQVFFPQTKLWGKRKREWRFDLLPTVRPIVVRVLVMNWAARILVERCMQPGASKRETLSLWWAMPLVLLLQETQVSQCRQARSSPVLSSQR